MPRTTTEPYTFHPYELDGWLIHAIVGGCFSGDTTVQVDPAPIILAEGFLVLHDPSIRALLDGSIFLDMPITQSIQRRDKVYKRTVPTPEYIEQVLKPMYEQFIAPTKRHADLVIDVVQRSAEDVYSMVMSWIRIKYPSLFLPSARSYHSMNHG